MSGVQLVHGGPPRTCSCCLIPEDHDSGELVDPITGLCMACQPCPICGETGGPCYDNGNYAVCLAPESPR